jgi:mannose-6-phosphate isomerase-like protein (cupin superfamily)
MLAAHRFASDGRPRDHLGQFADSIDTPAGWWAALWAPLGLRFHALHHLFPTLPFHNLRPAYRRLRGLKQELGGIPILALTATATRRVAGDIIRQLGMQKPGGFKGSFFRPNLRLAAHNKGDGRGSRQDLLAWIRARRGESGIVYALTRRNVESLAEFFTLDLQLNPQVFFARDDLTDIGDRDVSLRLIAAQRPNRAMTIMHERYRPKADTGSDMLSHKGEEGGVVVAGRIELTVGAQSRVLGPGDAYYFTSAVPHRFRNFGDDACEIISACTPPTF